MEKRVGHAADCIFQQKSPNESLQYCSQNNSEFNPLRNDDCISVLDLCFKMRYCASTLLLALQKQLETRPDISFLEANGDIITRQDITLALLIRDIYCQVVFFI